MTPKKLTKNREKDSKIIFGSKWSEENNEPTFRLNQKIENFFGSELSEANTLKNDKKSRKKKSRKIIFDSELFEPNNKPNFRLYQKLTKIEKKIEKLFLVQNFLKQKMN